MHTAAVAALPAKWVVTMVLMSGSAALRASPALYKQSLRWDGRRGKGEERFRHVPTSSCAAAAPSAFAHLNWLWSSMPLFLRAAGDGGKLRVQRCGHCAQCAARAVSGPFSSLRGK